MKLVVLGSNGYRPSDLGHTACYAIPELGLTLDAGTGLYRMVDYLQMERLDQPGGASPSLRCTVAARCGTRCRDTQPGPTVMGSQSLSCRKTSKPPGRGRASRWSAAR